MGHKDSDDTDKDLDRAQLSRELAELKERMASYWAFFNEIDEGFCLIEMIFSEAGTPIDYRFLEVNSAFEHQTGLHRVVGKSARELIPQLEQHWFTIYGRVANTGEKIRFQQDSPEMGRSFEVEAFRVGGEGSRKVGLLFSDITTEKRNLAALRESEARASHLADAVPQLVWIANQRGEPIYYNSQAARYNGIYWENGAWKWESAVHEEDREGTAVNWQHALRTGQTYQEEHRLKMVNGEYRWHLSRGFLMQEADGTARWYGTATDIHDLKTSEEAYRKAKEEAELAARVKEDFLARMSHEIRTPLNAIVGLADILVGQRPRNDQLINLETLRFSAQNLRTLVDDILDFSKIQAGQLKLKVIEFDLGDLLQGLVRAHQLSADAQRTKLHLVLGEDLPQRIRSDSAKLAQVLHNLLSNAIKFTSAGEVWLRVCRLTDEREHAVLEFSIEDTGIGIPKDKLDWIFDEFSQLDSSTARPYAGTGLGLSITKSLLELLGSDIEVRSEEGEGTCFRFTLAVEVAEGFDPSADQPQPPAEQSKLQGIRVLLVEDMLTNRLVFRQFMHRWRVTVDEVSNGRKAVDIVGQNRYDLIFMDVRMPVMDGYEATRVIRQLPGQVEKPTPIIALTADSAEQVAKSTEADFFADVITKPFDPGELYKVLLAYAADPEGAG